MARAYLGLGSNLGDRAQLLADAVAALPGVVAVSHVYETEPIGGPADQPPYLNLVVALETELTPRELLAVCQERETAAGRVRAERWGPRTLDVDILLFGDVVVSEPDLQIPHPRMSERLFVLEPLRELAPHEVDDAWVAAAAGRVTRVGPLDRLVDR